MGKTAYLDNGATTRPLPDVVQSVALAMTETYGNPSSLYGLGVRAEEAMGKARTIIAQKLGCQADELYFTSGATEANHLAILGAVSALKKRGNRIVTTALEHPSVYEPMKRLEQEGIEVVFLKPDASGHITTEQILEAVTPDTILVSVMKVNNELGTVFATDGIYAAVKQKAKHALIHCDAVQAIGKVSVNLAQVDLLSLSGHKLHGPKGVGALYIKKGVRIVPQMLGGGQEKGMRSGTEATAQIVGLGAAFAGLRNFEAKAQHLRRVLLQGVQTLNGAVINSPDDGVAHIVNFSLPGYQSETLLHFLEQKGIYVSGGSACAKGKRSRVLKEAGLIDERIDSALRVSFCADNEEEEVIRLIEALKEAQATLVRRK